MKDFENIKTQPGLNHYVNIIFKLIFQEGSIISAGPKQTRISFLFKNLSCNIQIIIHNFDFKKPEVRNKIKTNRLTCCWTITVGILIGHSLETTQ